MNNVWWRSDRRTQVSTSITWLKLGALFWRKYELVSKFCFNHCHLFHSFFFSFFFLSLSHSHSCHCLFGVSYPQIDLKHINQTKGDSNKVELGIDLREFYPSVEWDILGVPAERHEKYYPCCAEPYPGKWIDPLFMFYTWLIANVLANDIIDNFGKPHISENWKKINKWEVVRLARIIHLR